MSKSLPSPRLVPVARRPRDLSSIKRHAWVGQSHVSGQVVEAVAVCAVSHVPVPRLPGQVPKCIVKGNRALGTSFQANL